MNRFPTAVAILASLSVGVAVHADTADPDPARFVAEIEAFARWDSKNAVPANAILFVGSSSIRGWSTADAFPGLPVVNRGFGGSELSDVIHYYEQVIRPYAPTRVFLYAGDNDIAAGKSADQVFDDYRELAGRVQSDFPESELVFLAIKPSKARWDKWPVMAEANRMIREYADGHANLGYVDVATPLLDENGEPRDVYIFDGLHLDERGYDLWQQVLAPYLDQGD
jgi:lysophospholipase L1-like esterase